MDPPGGRWQRHGKRIDVITMINAVVHWEIGGRNLSGLHDFYAKAFDWTIDVAAEGYCLVQAVHGGAGGGLVRTHGTKLPHVTVYLDVEDLDAALANIAGLGGTALVPPSRINPSLSYALFQDPAGNAGGLLQGEPIDS